MKICKICLLEKPIAQFSGQTGSKDGKRHQCKSCELQRNQEWRINRKIKLDASREVDLKSLRKCSICKEDKPGKDFYRDSVSISGLQTLCKSCSRKNLDRWQKQGKYGLKPGDYEAMVEEQDNRCGICRTENPGVGGCNKTPLRWSIDHNHETNEVRGLLCPACNKGLGHFQDNILLLEAAIDWIKNGKWVG